MDYHFFLLLYLQFLEQHWRQSRHSKNTGCLDNLCWWFLTQRLQVSKNWLKNKMSLEYLEEAFTRFSEGLGRPLSCRGTEQTCLRWRYRCRARNSKVWNTWGLFWSKYHGVFKALLMRKQSQPSELEHAITSMDHPYCSILLQQEIHTTLDRHPPLNFKYLLYANKLLWNDLYSYLKLWKIQYNKKNYFLTFMISLISPQNTLPTVLPSVSREVKNSSSDGVISPIPPTSPSYCWLSSLIPQAIH